MNGETFASPRPTLHRRVRTRSLAASRKLGCIRNWCRKDTRTHSALAPTQKASGNSLECGINPQIAKTPALKLILTMRRRSGLALQGGNGDIRSVAGTVSVSAEVTTQRGYKRRHQQLLEVTLCTDAAADGPAGHSPVELALCYPVVYGGMYALQSLFYASVWESRTLISQR